MAQPQPKTDTAREPEVPVSLILVEDLIDRVLPAPPTRTKRAEAALAQMYGYYAREV